MHSQKGKRIIRHYLQNVLFQKPTLPFERPKGITQLHTLVHCQFQVGQLQQRTWVVGQDTVQLRGQQVGVLE